jgi:hypothetical protein
MHLSHESLLDELPRGLIQNATRLGLVLNPNLDRESWSRLVARLAQTTGLVSKGADTLVAWLGDVLAYGGVKYRGQIAEYAEAAGFHPATLRIAKLVCLRVPVLCRHNSLSWSHHVEVARAFEKPNEIRYWLELAADERLSKRSLRNRIRHHLRNSRESGAIGASGAAPFTLLRELRTAGRIAQNQQSVWLSWSPQTCKLALAEMGPLVWFVNEISARAEGLVATPI